MDQLSLFNDILANSTDLSNINKDWVGNSRSVVGCLGASNHSSEVRQVHDFYATDPVAAKWLMKLETLNHNIWEPACGQGHLSKIFEQNGFNVKSTDLIDRGFGQGGIDFLACTEVWCGDIITNPPYKYALEFIEHALSLTEDGNKVCMFLKVQFLEGKERRKRLFDLTPPCRIWVSSSRIACIKNGTDVADAIQAYAWYIWEKGYTGKTTLGWFN